MRVREKVAERVCTNSQGSQGSQIVNDGFLK